MKSVILSATVCGILVIACPLGGQVASQANARYQTSDGRQAVAAGLDAPDRGSGRSRRTSFGRWASGRV